jgi:PEGA domain
MIRVESVPPGASITLDGRATNEITPAPVNVAGDGPFTLRLAKRGYVTQDVKLTAEDLQRGSASYTLPVAEVQRVAVAIRSAYPVTVLSGNQQLSGEATTHDLNIAANTRVRVVSRELMLDAPISIGTRAVQYTAPGVGYLTVITNRYETCNVKINERPLGFPPITKKAIVAGEYRVDLVCQGGGNPNGQFVSITPNQTAMLKVQ